MGFKFQRVEKGFLRKWFTFSIAAGIVIPMFYHPQGYMSFEGLSKMLDDMLFSFLISMAISGSVGIIEVNLNTYVPWIKAPFKRLILEFLGVTILGFTSVFILSFIFYWALGGFTLDTIPWIDLLRFTRVPMYIGYGITAFFISRAFLREWRDAAVNVEKLRAEKYKGQVRLLRDQLNPHFLFNSFNVLIDVVYEDQDKAAEFIRELSKFYRHVLEVQNEDLVPIDVELDFTKRYTSLQQRRFGDALNLEMSITPLENEEIPPLVLQLLVENAIKHNKAEKAQALNISIKSTEDQLIVENNLNLKRNIEDGTGIGLDNIRKRYGLLSENEVVIEHTDDYFRVVLPRITLKPALR